MVVPVISGSWLVTTPPTPAVPVFTLSRIWLSVRISRQGDATPAANAPVDVLSWIDERTTAQSPVVPWLSGSWSDVQDRPIASLSWMALSVTDVSSSVTTAASARLAVTGSTVAPDRSAWSSTSGPQARIDAPSAARPPVRSTSSSSSAPAPDDDWMMRAVQVWWIVEPAPRMVSPAASVASRSPTDPSGESTEGSAGPQIVRL